MAYAANLLLLQGYMEICFVNSCDQVDQYAHLLTLSGIIPNVLPSYESMTPSELETFIQEMEPDIRAADRDMREIEALDQKESFTLFEGFVL